MIDLIISTIENEEQRNELADFYSTYRNLLCNIAYSKLNNRFDAEDAVQTVFAEIADDPEIFFKIAPRNRRAYVGIIVRNVSVEMYKKRNKIQLEELDEETEDTSFSLEDEVFDKITREELLSFMKQLPVEQQTVLLLHYYFDLTIYETAQRLHISVSTVNKRLRSARGAIRKFIDEGNTNHV